ncbi:hypothetical protein UPYG_G00118170 [Umbra pygmaea]|uniref:V-set and immunoglobulin domain-containing protein 1 n=1 Tax=Umbra pygmaea TaxID=75934 RepID=A0ABD0XPL4_UMBPY
MSSMLTLVVLFSLIGCGHFITVTAPERYINVTKGNSAFLQCTFVSTQQQSPALMIQWSFVAKNANIQQVYYLQSGDSVIPQAYKARLTPPTSPATTKNASIVISNMQVSDAGAYTCEVHNLPDISGKTEASITVNVLEMPSVPFCAVHGDMESGHLVTLTCHSEQGSPAPTYTWTRLGQDNVMVPVPFGNIDPTKGSLYIRNISQFEFGLYKCTSNNVVGSASCTVKLEHELGAGTIAGAVIGALLGALLIILMIWYLTHSMKKQKYQATKTTEMQVMPKSSTKAYEDTPNRGSGHQDSVTSRGVPMATPSHVQADADREEAQA